MNNKKTKILIAEDDVFISEVYVTKLSLVGYDVIGALDGEDALEKIRQQKPQIILLDIMMPKKSGLEVLKILREDEKTKNIPVILLTNVGERKSIDEAMALGAQDYLIKSNFTPEEVVGKIETLLSLDK